MKAAVPPLLVLAWGNPSRGDDALGPLLAERLLAHAQVAGLVDRVEVLTDFQLQVEHALDLVGRERLLFVDAALDLAEPFTVRPLQPARGGGIGSHALGSTDDRGEARCGGVQCDGDRTHLARSVVLTGPEFEILRKRLGDPCDTRQRCGDGA